MKDNKILHIIIYSLIIICLICCAFFITNKVINKKSKEHESGSKEPNKEQIIRLKKDFSNIKIEIDLPKGWHYEEISVDSKTYHKGINVYKKDKKTGFNIYDYVDKFAVCGTGLTNKKIKLNNNEEVTVGYYMNESKDWKHIYFGPKYDHLGVINNNLKDKEANEALEIIKTLNISNLK